MGLHGFAGTGEHIYEKAKHVTSHPFRSVQKCTDLLTDISLSCLLTVMQLLDSQT